jgi:hypothetical protein
MIMDFQLCCLYASYCTLCFFLSYCLIAICFMSFALCYVLINFLIFSNLFVLFRFIVLYVLFSILYVPCFCILFIVYPHVYSWLFSICIQFYRPLPPRVNPKTVNKYRII